MDPDATLLELRGLVNVQLTSAHAANADRMAELFNCLDDWIISGGFLPAAWERGQS
jgi:hypothetical protein